MDKIIIVDKNDKPISLKGCADLRYEDIYRVSALWLTDKNTDDCLITQRKWIENNNPGKWMAAAAGTVEEDETYDQSMVKEIEEEIGLVGLDLVKGPKVYVDDGKHKYFAQWFTASVNKDEVTIKIQEEEVEAYAWIKKSELIKEVIENPDNYVPSMLNAIKILGVS